jgi:hypothetical protein
MLAAGAIILCDNVLGVSAMGVRSKNDHEHELRDSHPTHLHHDGSTILMKRGCDSRDRLNRKLRTGVPKPVELPAMRSFA